MSTLIQIYYVTQFYTKIVDRPTLVSERKKFAELWKFGRYDIAVSENIKIVFPLC